MYLNNQKLAFIGGDCRLLYAANAFSDRGAECAVFANDAHISDEPLFTKARTLKDALTGAAAVILPIPVSRDGYTLNAPFYHERLSVESVAKMVSSDTCLCAGLTGELFDGYDFSVLDYALDEKFACRNADFTAEGAISIAIDKTKVALFDAKCCVFGFGRIGKALVKRLSSFGTDLTVFARDPKDRKFIEHLGHTAKNYPDFDACSDKWDLIFNTVPDSQVASLYRGRSSTALIIELAGQNAESTDIINASSLPSVYSPKSAGILIRDTVMRSFDICRKEVIQ